VRRESGMEECGNTLGVQAPSEPLELSIIDHSMWCEQHAPERRYEEETSLQEVVAWLRNDTVNHLKRGKVLRETLPLTYLV
jgi:hypothetical protein